MYYRTTVMDSSPWSFITLHGQYLPIRIGLYCQVPIWPSKYKESVLHVCDKPYNTNNEIQQHWEEIEMWNCALVNTVNTLTNSGGSRIWTYGGVDFVNGGGEKVLKVLTV